MGSAAAAQTPLEPAPQIELGLRLPDPGWLDGLTPLEPRAVPTPDALVRETAPGLLGTRRTDAIERAEGLQLVGGVAMTYVGPDGMERARAWAVQLAGPGEGQAGVDATRWMLRGGGGELSVRALERPAGALVVEATRPTGARTATVAFAREGWLYGIELSDAVGGQPDTAALERIARSLDERLPRLDTALGPVLLGVSPTLEADLARARIAARGPRRGAILPVPGTTLAASSGDLEWALASFEGRRAELELFQRRAGGSWRALGGPGGPGCPRIPDEVRAVWGLGGACPSGASPITRPDDADAGDPELSPLRGPGIWVWELSRVGGPAALARRAKTLGVRTVFLKSGDGARYWRQLDAAIEPLHEAGLRVCGWQYVYGRAPIREARVLARAARSGADCLVVDAEGEFERRRSYAGPTHRAARRYMRELRRRVGRRVPVAMSSFAYTDVHGAFPYSAFAESPFGVDAFMPQVYWGAFGTRMASATRRAMRWNTIYGLPVAPIAGTYRGERAGDLRGFRCLAADLGADGVSYWSLQHTRTSQLPALALPTRCSTARTSGRGATRYAHLAAGASGDPVVWLQTRLRQWGSPIPRTGHFRSRTRAAVRAFQRSRGIPATGRVDDRTWDLLLQRVGRGSPGA